MDVALKQQGDVRTHQGVRQHVQHHIGIDVVSHYDPTERDADQIAGFPLRDRSPGAILTQELIVRGQQWFCPIWTFTW